MVTFFNEEYAQVGFSHFDIVFFSVILIFSALVGLYFSLKKTQPKTLTEYLMGSNKMKTVPVGISLIANKISTITVLAVPSEVYRFGAGFWLSSFSIIIGVIVSIYVYLPVFFKIKSVSTFDYLEKRFDAKTKILGSLLFVLNVVLFLPMFIYTPALTFSICTGINIHLIIWLICGVCAFYTTIGGLKTVIWTDVLQFIIIVVGFVMVIVLGLKSVGGIQNVWIKASRSDRLDLFNFDPDPTRRESFWIIIVGYTVTFISIVGVGQVNVQKMCSVPTIRSAAKTLILYGLGSIVTVTVNAIIGLTIYARYSDCDPFLSKKLKHHDQLVPYFVMDIGKSVYGLSGIFLGTSVCAALSTLSVSLNSLSGVIYNDFVLKFMKRDVSEKTALMILKIIVVILSVISGLTASVFDRIDNIFSLCISLVSLTIGPKLAMFSLGILFPRANSKGAFYGTIGGLLFITWLTVQTRYYQYQGLFKYNPKPLSTENCTFLNATHPAYPPLFVNETLLNEYKNATFPAYPPLIDNETISNEYNSTFMHGMNYEQQAKNSSLFKPHFIFRISFHYSTLVGAIVTTILGIMISCVTNKHRAPVDKDLLSPICKFYLKNESSKIDDLHHYNSIEAAANKLQENSL